VFSVPVGCLACPRTRCVVAQGPALVSAVVLPGSVLGGASWSRATYACAEAALVARTQDGRFEAPPPLEALIALNAAVFLAWLLLPRQWMARNFELAAGALRRRPWTAATATVSHATLFDLTGNVQARSRRRAHVTLSAAASGDAAGTSHCWLVGCLLHRQRLGCSHRGRRPRWAPWLSPSPPARRRCGQPCMHAPLPREHWGMQATCMPQSENACSRAERRPMRPRPDLLGVWWRNRAVRTKCSHWARRLTCAWPVRM